MLTKGIWKSLPSQAFYFLVVSTTYANLRLPKYMVIGRSSDTICTIFDHMANFPQMQVNNTQDKNAINLVSASLSQELPWKANQYDADNRKWQDSIDIPEE